MFDWLTKRKPEVEEDTDGYTVRFKKAGLKRLNSVLANSAHTNKVSIILEALKVVEAVYKEDQGAQRDIICCVEDGKIVMYVDTDDDGGDREPERIYDQTNVVSLFKKVA